MYVRAPYSYCSLSCALCTLNAAFKGQMPLFPVFSFQISMARRQRLLVIGLLIFISVQWTLCVSGKDLYFCSTESTLEFSIKSLKVYFVRKKTAYFFVLIIFLIKQVDNFVPSDNVLLALQGLLLTLLSALQTWTNEIFEYLLYTESSEYLWVDFTVTWCLFSC